MLTNMKARQNLISGRKRPLRPRTTRTYRPRVESLEERRVLSAIGVNTFYDVVDASDGLMSLREAITAAALSPGADTIQIDNGTYALDLGQLFINDDSGKLTIEALEEAELDAQGASRVVHVVESDVELNNLTFTGGVDQQGAGIRVTSSELTMNNSVVRNNAASDAGGGLGVEMGSNVTLNGTRISNNTARLAAGIDLNGRMTPPSKMTLNDSVIVNNRATGDFGGMGIRAGGSAVLNNSIVSDNRAGAGIGGIGAGGGNMVLNHTIVSDNTAGQSVGGIGVGGGSGRAVLNDSIVNNNTAGQFGAGIGMTNGASLVLNNSAVSNNTAGEAGGGILSGSPGGGAPANSIELNNSHVGGNVAPVGGGIALGEGENSLVLNDSDVTGNRATTPNQWGNGSGGGILMDPLGTNSVELYGSDISHNSAVGSGGGIQMNGTLIVGSNSQIFDNESGDLSGDSQLSSLFVDSGGVLSTDVFGGSLSAVNEVTIEGILLAELGSATNLFEVVSTLTLSSGSELQLHTISSLASTGEQLVQIAAADRIHGTFGTVPSIGEHLGFGVFTAELVGTGTSAHYSNDGVSINLRQAAAGDANGDGAFDQNDIVRILQSGTYLTGVPADWTDGDFTHDGLVDQLDVVAAMQTGTYLVSR